MMRTSGNSRELAREKLVTYIDSLDIDKDNRLPSEDKLCEIVGVSRITIRAVLDELIAEGRVLRQRGMRSCVNPEYHRIKALLYPYVSIEMNIRAIGCVPKSTNLRTQTVKASEEVAGALHIKPGDAVVRSTHLFYANNTFCVLCYDYLDARFLTKEDINRLNMETSVIFKLLYEKTGRKMSWDLLEITIADTVKVPELAEHAGFEPMQRKAYLETSAAVYDVNNRPIFFAKTFYDPDYFTFGMVRKRRYDFEDFESETLQQSECANPSLV